MDEKELALQLRERANKLLTAASVLDGTEPPTNPAYARAGERRRTGPRQMSAAARARLSKAQKLRWKQRKQTEKANTK